MSKDNTSIIHAKALVVAYLNETLPSDRAHFIYDQATTFLVLYDMLDALESNHALHTALALCRSAEKYVNQFYDEFLAN